MLVPAIMAGCDTADVADGTDNHTDSTATVTLTVSSFDMVPFSEYFATGRAAVTARELCSKLTFVLHSDNVQVGEIKQQLSEQSFGTTSVSLAPGTYRLTTIGYSSTAYANADDLQHVTFASNHIGDTFLAVQDFTVGRGDTKVNIELSRIAACVRLQLTDTSIPTEVKLFRCYCTGGGTTLNALTGYAAAEGYQTEDVTLSDDNSINIYTLPLSSQGSLEITIQARNSKGQILAERAFHNVPVKPNYVTTYKGEFFKDDSDDEDTDMSITVKGNVDWAGTMTYTF